MKIKIKRIFLESLLNQVYSASRGDSLGKNCGFSFIVNPMKGLMEVCRTDDESLFVVGHTKDFVCDSFVAEEIIKFSVSSKLSMISELRDDFVFLELDGDYLNVFCGDFKASLRMMNFEVSDKWSSTKFSGWVEIDSDKFLEAISRTNYAIGRDGVRLDLGFLNFSDGKCWATDFFRYQDVHIDIGKNLNLPLVALDIVSLIKESGVKKIEYSENEEYLGFRVGENMFICKKLSVSPVDWDLVKHFSMNNSGNKLWIDTAFLVGVIKRILLTSEKSSPKISFFLRDGDLFVSGKDSFGNRSEQKLDVSVTGDSDFRECQIFGAYFLQALKSVNDKSIQLVFGEKMLSVLSSDSTGVVPLIRED